MEPPPRAARAGTGRSTAEVLQLRFTHPWGTAKKKPSVQGFKPHHQTVGELLKLSLGLEELVSATVYVSPHTANVHRRVPLLVSPNTPGELLAQSLAQKGNRLCYTVYVTTAPSADRSRVSTTV